jgi:hypothetical protein
MNSKPSIAKKVASVAAGTALAASLYANAVYQPRNESALEQALDRELQAVVSGDAELTLVSDGFVVVERAPVAAQDTSKLVQEIAQLEAEMQSSSREATEKLAAVERVSAYRVADVVRVVQSQVSQDTAATKIGQLASALGISGLNVGATIGQLATISSSPFISSAIIEIATTTFTPGSYASVAGATAGLSAPAAALVAGILGGSSASTIANSVAAAAANSTGSSAVTGNNLPSSP